MKFLYYGLLSFLMACTVSLALADSKFTYFYEMGGIAIEEGEITKAIGFYNKSFERAKTKKEKVKALGGIISSNEKKGNVKAVNIALKTLLKIDPRNKWALKKKKAKRSRKKSSTKFSYYYESAGIAFKNEDYEKAINYYTSAFDVSKMKKEKIKALGGLVSSYDNFGDNRQSRAALRALLKLDPKNKWALAKI